MKILVGIKRVVDYNVRVRVLSDGSGVDTDGVKMSVNPFDEIALEEALRIKEAGKADEVVVVSIGGDACQQQLRTGLAMGADRAIQVQTTERLQPLNLARAFLKVIERENPGLVILGKQAIDDDNSQTAQMLAALWNRPQATFASKLVLDGTTATVTREVDSGLETLEVDLNEPRFVKLPDIMKAKRKPLDVLPLADLGVDAASNLSVKRFAPPPQRAKGIMVEDAAQLVQELKNRGLL
jgi:electron transfer flavoprotein beta subunit